MIGNDIIDLQLAATQSNWRRTGWVEKIFTLEEQKLINLSKDQDTTVWQLWSRKEAVYKAHQRRFNLAPVFNPKDFSCHKKDKVFINGNEYQTRSCISSEYIYSETAPLDIKKFSKIFKNTQSVAQTKLIDFISDSFTLTPDNFKIDKDKYSIPQLYIDEKKHDVAFSITHHGRFSAFSISLHPIMNREGD